MWQNILSGWHGWEHVQPIDGWMHVFACFLNAGHIDCNVELIKMGDILISAGNKGFFLGGIYMGKMLPASSTALFTLRQGRSVGH